MIVPVVLQIALGCALPLVVWLLWRQHAARAGTADLHGEVERLRDALVASADDARERSAREQQLVAMQRWLPQLRSRLMAASLNATTVARGVRARGAVDPALDEALADLTDVLGALCDQVRASNVAAFAHERRPGGVRAAFERVGLLHSGRRDAPQLDLRVRPGALTVTVPGGEAALVRALDGLVECLCAVEGGDARLALEARESADGGAVELALVGAGVRLGAERAPDGLASAAARAARMLDAEVVACTVGARDVALTLRVAHGVPVARAARGAMVPQAQ